MHNKNPISNFLIRKDMTACGTDRCEYYDVAE